MSHRTFGAAELGATHDYDSCACFQVTASVDLAGILWSTAASTLAGLLGSNTGCISGSRDDLWWILEGVDCPRLVRQIGH